MRLRYELRDTHHPDWRGQRFTNRDAAFRELAQAVGDEGRFELYDREDKKVLAKSRSSR